MTVAPTPHLLLRYEYVEDIVERRVPHREGHLALLRRWRDEGRLVMGGGVGDPIHSGVIVLRGDVPAIAQELVDADPYSAAGLIVRWSVEPYAVVV